jgi:hypothetical protein
MAKRDTRAARATRDVSTSGGPSGRADVIERRVVAFAEQLGRIAGTIQARTEGWRDRKALSRQIGRVRDGAVHLLQQLAGGEAASPRTKAGTRVARRAANKRSRGPVDAPGKKHRTMPPNPDAQLAGSQEAKLRAAKPMAKTKRHRARA